MRGHPQCAHETTETETGPTPENLDTFRAHVFLLVLGARFGEQNHASAWHHAFELTGSDSLKTPRSVNTGMQPPSLECACSLFVRTPHAAHHRLFESVGLAIFALTWSRAHPASIVSFLHCPFLISLLHRSLYLRTPYRNFHDSGRRLPRSRPYIPPSSALI